VRSNYISKEAHLEIFLVYLKDIEVKLNDAEIHSAINEAGDDAILVGELSQTPYTQMLENWMSQEDFESLRNTKIFTSCIYQLKKIIRAQLVCAQQAIKKYGINYFTFGDVIMPMEQDEFEKFYYKHYWRASKENEGLNMLIKIKQPLTDFDNMLDRKHIKGVVLTR